MHVNRNPLLVFLRFGALSGLGWVLDFATFTILVKFLALSGPVSNFLSSYVGITFVYFASLKTVFQQSGHRTSRYLPVYWGFQLISIVIYSGLLRLVVGALSAVPMPLTATGGEEIAAKIIITPLNLLTNFAFMRFLTRQMHRENSPDA